MAKDMECGKWKMKHGIGLIILGVLIWLNVMYNVLSWAMFIAVIAIILGIIKLIMGAVMKK